MFRKLCVKCRILIRNLNIFLFIFNNFFKLRFRLKKEGFRKELKIKNLLLQNDIFFDNIILLLVKNKLFMI